ncbi:MAG: peptide-methionine (S)-S-oxide reductase MsrA [Deinococcota bacterium]|jgi:peptide-methionine (S)-S-oxide reductase|nr:peptide-methionine (S)-S-oxide reductase MsrA [Deinococcota bacterium]
MPSDREAATLGGGCFWCVEAVFVNLQGVEEVVSGYSGGQVANPSYQQVCSETTGHAEVVQITFDPKAISYREILEIFLTTHDPTQRNRQGGDVGSQYRSVIFYHSAEQRATAEQVIAEFDRAGTWGAPIITELAPLTEFYPAEAYHQDYYAQNQNQPYCRAVIAPKVAKVRQKYRAKLKP